MSAPDIKGCYLHFTRRVRERIGDHIPPRALWNVLTKAVQENDEGIVTYVGRLNKRERRLWRFQVSGDTYFLIFDHDLECPITVLLPGGNVRCHPDLGCEQISLEAVT